MPESSVDAIVTDPPYELGFMGKSWDSTGIANNVAMWREALRVLKPGGHLLAFSSTRTYHRMVCAIEDAGFDIRDQIGWAYGTGFPKSRDVAKAIDATILHGGGKNDVDGGAEANPLRTEAARQWQGWGTALKPAWEPIVVARKPLAKGATVATNVMAHGTGALNIGGCRVAGPGGMTWETPRGGIWATDAAASAELVQNDVGRWPANLIHDGSDEVLAQFPQSNGQQGALTGAEPSSKTANAYGKFAGRAPSEPRGDTGSAARFFYCAKASKADREDGNTHPTVKPTDLMRYLCRLVTPPGGLVLDPFTGSGSTGKAATLEGFRFIGFEMSPEYAAMARSRIDDVQFGHLA
jgi:site-specific DNA-methyltransferase (adenine-specific)